jgi:hypothetical protein
MNVVTPGVEEEPDDASSLESEAGISAFTKVGASLLLFSPSSVENSDDGDG